MTHLAFNSLLLKLHNLIKNYLQVGIKLYKSAELLAKVVLLVCLMSQIWSVLNTRFIYLYLFLILDFIKN